MGRRPTANASGRVGMGEWVQVFRGNLLRATKILGHPTRSVGHGTADKRV